MRRMRFGLLIAFVAMASPSLAKGGGPGFWMEGTLSRLSADGTDIHFVLAGRFWVEQYHGNQRSTVEVDGQRGIFVTVFQGRPFFGMSAPDWRAGAVGESGKLLAILKAAVERHRVVRFELFQPKLDFAEDNRLTVVKAGVIRATDHDLK